MKKQLRQLWLRLKHRDFRRLPKGWSLAELDAMQVGYNPKFDDITVNDKVGSLNE